MTTDEVLWDIEPHTEAKHKILKYYLGAWFPILAKTQNRLLYVDGFAGPGEYRKEDGSLVDGSPIIALKVVREHVLASRLQRPDKNLVFLFIERDAGRHHNLSRKCREEQWPSNFEIRLRNASFADVFDEVLASIEQQNKILAPSFVFIDPFGPTGFPMSLVERLAQQPRSEVLVTFNSQALNRWYLSDPTKHEYVNETYGSDIWRPALSIAEPAQRERYLIQAYQNVLQGIGWKGRSFRMVNKHNQTQYYLFFATTHWQGMLAMKAAMWRVSTGGSFSYSDFTNQNQLLLFDQALFNEEYSQDLASRMYDNRRGHSVPKQTLVQTDLAWHPMCIKRHLRRALTILEYESTPSRIAEVQKSHGKRRERTYPDGCTIVFAP